MRFRGLGMERPRVCVARCGKKRRGRNEGYWLRQVNGVQWKHGSDYQWNEMKLLDVYTRLQVTDVALRDDAIHRCDMHMNVRSGFKGARWLISPR